MKTMFDVAVISNVGIDTNVYFSGNEVNFEIDAYRTDFIDYADVLFFSSVNFESPRELLEPLLNQYPEKIIIAGMESKGCALGNCDGIQYFEALDLREPVIDTNGAGDGLAVGFISDYCIEKMSLSDSIRRGQIVARHTCTQKANSSNMLTRKQLDKLISDN